jgi:hypothetical protein
MVSISYNSVPRTGFVAPNEAEAARLLKLVTSMRPDLGLVGLIEFRRAFAAIGYMFRTEQPVTKYAASHFLDAGNEMLERWGESSIGGAAFVSAIKGHGDICWRAGDRSLGQSFEIGLNLYEGRPCENRWRQLLSGTAALMAPVPPNSSRVAARQARDSISYRRLDGSPVGGSLWSKS